jgi:hypothetical protein
MRNRAVPIGETRRPRVLVRDAADINRLIFHLFTHWTLPRVDFHIESAPAVAVQRIQHRIERISERRSSGIGLILTLTILLAGAALMWVSLQSLIWTPRQFGQNLGLTAIAALCAGSIGAGIYMAWIRMRILLVLGALRRRLVAGDTLDVPANYMGHAGPEPAAKVAAAEDDGQVRDNLMRHSVFARSRQPSVLLQDMAGFHRLIIHLFTHWTLPRVRIGVDGVATLDVQRAQHHIARLTDACDCELGAWLAGATVLGGAFYVEWTSTQNWDWWVPESWGPLGLVFVAAPVAGLIGTVVQKLWNRMRLLLVLHRVRHRLRA